MQQNMIQEEIQWRKNKNTYQTNNSNNINELEKDNTTRSLAGITKNIKRNIIKSCNYVTTGFEPQVMTNSTPNPNIKNAREQRKIETAINNSQTKICLT